MYRIFPGEIPDLLSTNYTRQPLFTSNPNPNCNVTREGNNSCKKRIWTASKRGWETSEVSLVRSGLRIPQRAGLDPTWVWECCLVSSHSPQTCRRWPLLNCSNHLPPSKHHCSACTGPTCPAFYQISLSSGEEVHFRCEVPAPSWDLRGIFGMKALRDKTRQRHSECQELQTKIQRHSSQKKINQRSSY